MFEVSSLGISIIQQGERDGGRRRRRTNRAEVYIFGEGRCMTRLGAEWWEESAASFKNFCKILFYLFTLFFSLATLMN